MASLPLIVAQVRGQSALLWDGTLLRESSLAGRLKVGAASSGTTTLAAGDHVEVEEVPGGPLRVIRVAPRRTQLERSAGRGRTQIVAANADQAMIVASLREPVFSPGLVDRWSLLARRGGIVPVLALNKADLGTEAEAASAVHQACIPLDAIRVSAVTGLGLEALRERIHGRRTVLVGHSGVGKSSLLQRILPDAEAATGALSEKSGKGRHTTTSSRLYPLPEGGFLIDTPGVRSVVLGATRVEEVASIFREIAEAPPCRFNPCTHRVEPGCSVLQGLEAGVIPRAVYARYRKLLEEADVR